MTGTLMANNNLNLFNYLYAFGLQISGVALTSSITKLNYLSGITSTNGSLIFGTGSSLSNLNIGTSDKY